MTALKEYQRLEASGLWRPTAEDQRREVVVSVGEATLTISDLNDRPLTHWSLAALERINPGQRPAIYCPDGDPGETLELAAGEDQMTDAIERLRRAVERARPRPGRLRLVGVLAVSGAVLALLVLWLPGAMTRHAVEVVPTVKRQEIGQALLGRIERVAGGACGSPETRRILARLARRTGVRQIVVLPSGVPDALGLPGSVVVLNKALLADQDDPGVAAGFVLREQVRAATEDPLAALLAGAGPIATFRLLTTGEVTQRTLDRHAETLLIAPRAPVPDAALQPAFAESGIDPAAFARVEGRDAAALTGPAPAGGQAKGPPAPVLPDRDWLLLQGICG